MIDYFKGDITPNTERKSKSDLNATEISQTPQAKMIELPAEVWDCLYKREAICLPVETGLSKSVFREMHRWCVQSPLQNRFTQM